MQWRLYKKDNPNTWPQIDCPMVVYNGRPFYHKVLDILDWDNSLKGFRFHQGGIWHIEECYYAYIGYVPSGYKTLYPVKCMKKGMRCADNDDGYCMFENKCEFAKTVPEYEIEKKRIWKEFE